MRYLASPVLGRPNVAGNEEAIFSAEPCFAHLGVLAWRLGLRKKTLTSPSRRQLTKVSCLLTRSYSALCLTRR